MKKEQIQTAIFAGGCFWCTEAVFVRLSGVISVTSGYIGGAIKNPAYREICTGRTGHAEAIKITYDSEIITFQELLEVFFATHDPTTLNQQANDRGTQYRSSIFYQNEDQKDQAQQYIEFLDQEHAFENPIVTQLEPDAPFYIADDTHQDYYDRNRVAPYCQVIIDPKIKTLQSRFREKLKSNIPQS